MRKLTQFLAAPLLLASTLAFAETAAKKEVPPPPPPPEEMGMQHGMGGMMGHMSDAQREEHLRAMQDHMLKMHELSSQILAEKDPAKKEQLKQQQRDLMKEHHKQKMERHHSMMQHGSK
jgi:hypothetical protein